MRERLRELEHQISRTAEKLKQEQAGVMTSSVAPRSLELEQQAPLGFVQMDSSLSSQRIKPPLIGGIFKDDSTGSTTLIPWSGTDPDNDALCFSWSDDSKMWVVPYNQFKQDATQIKGALHLGMYRPTNPKEARKTEEACTKYVGIKFNGLPKKSQPNMSIRVYKDMIRGHMIKTGMWDIFNIPHPDGKQSVDLLKQHAMFDMEYIKEYEEKLLNDPSQCDSYMQMNFTMSGDYLRMTLNADFLKQVLKFTSVSASGLFTFMAIMHECFSDGYDALVSIKNKLRQIKLKDYPGENVEACAEQILQYSERLYCAGAFEDDLLCDILRIFEEATDGKFRLWAMNQYRECKDYVKSRRLGKKTSVAFTYDDICEKAVSEYQDLVDSGRWELKGVEKNTEEPELPKSYKAEITSAVKKAFNQTSSSGNGHGHGNSKGSGNSNEGQGNRNKCWNCGGNHLRKNCPQLQNQSASNTNSNNHDQNGNETPWYLVPPSDGKDTMKKNKVTYHYCRNCEHLAGEGTKEIMPRVLTTSLR